VSASTLKLGVNLFNQLLMITLVRFKNLERTRGGAMAARYANLDIFRSSYVYHTYGKILSEESCKMSQILCSFLLLGMLKLSMSDASLNNSESVSCLAYENRQYLSEEDMRPPVMLLSVPGSGNTWVRQLIDYSVGIFTGSIYSDWMLFDILPGERFCGQRLSG
jgi:hypothetical protein